MALGNSFEAEGAEVATDTASALLEARREVRVGAQHPVEVYCSSFDLPLAAQVRDISAGGMCIATPSPIPVEKLAGVGLQLPGGNLRINAAGVIPIIFAQSIMFLPGTLKQFWPQSELMQSMGTYFSKNSLF